MIYYCIYKFCKIAREENCGNRRKNGKKARRLD
jgi:hypothetical protein